MRRLEFHLSKVCAAVNMSHDYKHRETDGLTVWGFSVFQLPVLAPAAR